MSDDKNTTCADLCLQAPATSRDEERKAKKAAYDVEYRKANKEKRAAQVKDWCEANPERLAETKKVYREANKEKISARRKAYREANKEKLAEYFKAHHEANREDKAEYDKDYREANKRRIAARRKANHESNRERDNFQRQRWRLKKEYGLTPEAYDALLESQSHKCAVCGVPFVLMKSRNRHVDHCHKTGRVRGILCHSCNKALGHVNDNPKILRALIRYLKLHAKE